MIQYLKHYKKVDYVLLVTSSNSRPGFICYCIFLAVKFISNNYEIVFGCMLEITLIIKYVGKGFHFPDYPNNEHFSLLSLH